MLSNTQSYLKGLMRSRLVAERSYKWKKMTDYFFVLLFAVIGSVRVLSFISGYYFVYEFFYIF